MPVSEKPRKKYKPRETDPIKLIMERGIRVETWTEVDDESGEEHTFTRQLAPQGVVLDGIQVNLVASFIASQQARMNVMEGLIDEYQRLLAEEDEEEDLTEEE